MRRLVISIFLLFYTFSVAGLTLKRTENWASENAQQKHKPPHHVDGFAPTHKHSPHTGQSKLHEDTSVLISLLPTSRPSDTETTLHLGVTSFVADQKSRSISSRAPPSLL